MSDLPVIFDELPTACGGRIGVATLNAPRSLNSLSLEMARQLEAKLDAWAVDRNVVAVWLEGGGDKAFCAGGDVVALYRALTEEGENRGSGRDSELPATYFTVEYRLDYRIHTYPKPVMVWADGIVMGGGLGLTAGGLHRIVTETTLIAMPEITIGLYPDIGASWFLNRMPPGVGAYLGLTGAQLNARDALDVGLADRFVPRERRAAVLEALGEADFGDRSLPGPLRAAGCRPCSTDFEAAATSAGRVRCGRIRTTIQALVGRCGRRTAAKARSCAMHSDDGWLAANRKRLAAGCPISAHLVWRMLQRHAHTSLADAFRDELVLSVQCCRRGDLRRGGTRAAGRQGQARTLAAARQHRRGAPGRYQAYDPLWSSEAHPARPCAGRRAPG